MLHVGQTNEHAPMELKTIDTTKDTPFVTQFERILRTSKLTQWKMAIHKCLFVCIRNI